jgi:hypothetical protein
MGSEARASADVLTPAQREQLRQAMVNQINAITRQVNTLTKGVDHYIDFRERTFWQRLRWLVTGR